MHGALTTLYPRLRTALICLRMHAFPTSRSWLDSLHSLLLPLLPILLHCPPSHPLHLLPHDCSVCSSHSPLCLCWWATPSRKCTPCGASQCPTSSRYDSGRSRTLIDCLCLSLCLRNSTTSSCSRAWPSGCTACLDQVRDHHYAQHIKIQEVEEALLR